MTITLSEAEQTRLMRKTFHAGLIAECKLLLSSLYGAAKFPEYPHGNQAAIQEHVRDAAALLVIVRQSGLIHPKHPLWKPREWLHSVRDNDWDPMDPTRREYESQAAELIERQLQEMEG